MDIEQAAIATDANFGSEKFQQRLRERREQQKTQEDERLKWAAFIPDVEPPTGVLSEYQQQVNEFCSTLTLRDVYNRLSKNKYEPGHENRTGEGIKISCPNPAHPDEHPSAWINTEKVSNKGEPGGVGKCGSCDIGFDKYDVAGYALGLDPHTDLNTIKKFLALTFGGIAEPAVTPSAPASPVVVVPERTGNVPSVPATAPMATGGTSVPDDESTDDATEDESHYPTYDLKTVLPGGATFLDLYCAEALKADVPREFPLWAGLAILSVVIGRSVALKMIEVPTYGNLAICLTARSASGKGRASRPARHLLQDELLGVRVERLPGSAEKLIANLVVSSPGVPPYSPPALVEFEEMQMLVTKGSGTSAYKPYIIEFADCLDVIRTSSGSNGTHEVRDGFVTFLTGTQPKHLRDQFTKRDMGSGLLNRFVFPFGRAVEQRAWGVVEQDWTKTKAALEVTAQWWRGRPRNSADGKGYWITTDAWNDDARDEWIQQYGLRINPMKMGENSDLLGRMDVIMLKLVLLFACNEMSERVTLQHVRSAFALYDYIAGCALNLAREVNRTEMSDQMLSIRATVEKLEKQLQKPPTLRDLKKHSTTIRSMNDEDWSRAIYRLASAKMLFHVNTKSATGKGRTGEAWTTSLGLWDGASVSVTPVTSGANNAS